MWGKNMIKQGKLRMGRGKEVGEGGRGMRRGKR